MLRRSARAYRLLLKCGRGVAALEFVLVAPALLMLAFGIIVYTTYFTASVGVRQAAAEGARAAVAGLSASERVTLAETRAREVIANYRFVLGSAKQPVVTAAPGATLGTFKVTVGYDMTGTPVMMYGSFIPVPAKNITASVTVTNGGY